MKGPTNLLLKKAMSIDKITSITSVIGGVIASHFFTIMPFLNGMYILLFIDMVVGVRDNLKHGQKFEYKRLIDSIDKLIVYTLAVVSAHVMFILFKIDFLVYIVSFGICFVEFRSIIGHTSRITDIALIQYIDAFLSNKMNDEMEKINKLTETKEAKN